MSWLLCRWDNHIEQSLEMPIKRHLPCWGNPHAPILIMFIRPTRCDWDRLHGWRWRNQSVSGLFERSLRPSPLRWHLPNVLRHIRPRWDNKLGGVFLFLLVVVMVDRVEASKNLEILKANQARLMNYNHLFSSHAFRQDCGAELRKIGRQIASIEKQLNA